MKDATYKSYLISVLLVILALNFTDRWALGLALENIKADLALSDTQLGFVSGIAFALFYSVMGIPIARWADRGNRVAIISLTAAVWSVMVALCGVAGSFKQLLLIRIGVGIGEAGCIPPALSLIADYFTRTERPRAVSVYMQGVTVSLVIGYFVAGWLNEFYGWRAMFVVVGLPGLAVAALGAFSLREPRRHQSQTAASWSDPPTLKDVCLTLWTNATFRHLLYAYSVLSFFNYGILQWTPTFFVRSFGLKTGDLGTWFAIMYGLSGLLGTYWGGEWASRRAARNERLQLRAFAIMVFVSALFGAFMYLPALAPNRYWAFGWLGVSTMVGIMINGPMFSVLQTLVPERMRAMSIALVYLFANLIGMGLGPWATGAMSDALRPWFGEESLRYALLAICPGYLWVSWHFWQAGRTVSRDLTTVLEADTRDLCDEEGTHASFP